MCGGQANLLQYYIGGDPQIVLRNIWTAPNGNNLQGLLTVGLNISIQ